MLDNKNLISSIRVFPFDQEQVPRNVRRLRSTKVISVLIGFGVLLGTALVALNITTLVRMERRWSDVDVANDDDHDDGYGRKAAALLNGKALVQAASPLDMESAIRIEEVMSHLNELQRIGSAANGTRAIGTEGFNQTLNYIFNYLSANTNYRLTKSFFPVRNFALAGDPVLASSIDGATKNYTYSSDVAKADFYFVKYSTGANLSNFVELTAIPDVGCTDQDWQNARPAPAGRVVLVKRGVCLFRDKAILAAKYRAAGLLLYNDGLSPDRVPPIEVSLNQANNLPALFLSSTVGQALATAAQNTRTNTRVRFRIPVRDLPPSPVGNICADTPTGDATQTIVIGSHSDSVPAGPGINDNGSGSAANLGLAISLARLFRTSAYPKYKYRVRFCWWGAEEVGLLGSEDHVKKAKTSTVVGDRLQDYLINLNYDMLASPNYIFGIYDGRTARNDTPTRALAGSNKITALFRDWFVRQNLPWDYTDFSGRSDYGPFLAEGIVAGGLFSGADDIKTQKQRDRYDETLGQGMGGIPDIIQDPCYHKACDSIQNVNVFGYEKMVKAAAYVLEYLGRQDDLKGWLYPTPAIQQWTVEK